MGDFNNKESGQETPQWDLSALFENKSDKRIADTVASVSRQAQDFATRYEGKVGILSAGERNEAFLLYQHLMQEAAKPAAYASLLAASDTTPENGAFGQHIREETTRATLPLLFFALELQNLSPEAWEACIAQAAPEFTYFLQTLQSRAPFRLSLPEERILEETANTGRRALVRLYEEITAHLRFTMEGDQGDEETTPLSLPQVLDLQAHPDRNVREKSADALTRGLQTQAETLTFLFNTLTQNKATEDRLRGHEYPEHERHLLNDLPAHVVETVAQTAEAGYPLVARFYRAKRRLLGLPALSHYDRYAPLPGANGDDAEIPFAQAKTQVLSAFRAFDSTYADAAQAFFDNHWIDARPRPDKRGGAFCAYATPDLHPFILMSYLGKPGDVKTLAHELGHGVHSYLSRGNGFLTYHGTLPLAEVASTFAEMLVFDVRKDESKVSRRAALAHQIDHSVATIFRQTALNKICTKHAKTAN